ncbi:MAG: hypothetical protein U1F42_01955 [Candidatus Competibacteraceae bacterium]
MIESLMGNVSLIEREVSMKSKMWGMGAMIAIGLGVASLGHAGESALAEEIWSERFCEQAVALARQQGEKPEALSLVACRLLNYYQPSYWQCVLSAMRSDRSLGLAAARQRCLANY